MRSRILSSPQRSCWRRSAPGPPTSWCGGRRATTPRRTRRSGRSSPPSSRRPASRSSSSFHRRRSFQTKIAGGARGRPATRLRSSALSDISTTNNGPTRVGSSTSPTPSATSRTCSIRMRSTAPRCSTRRPAGVASTCCRWAYRPTTSTSGRACWSRPASPSRTSRRSGRRSGRSGAIRSSRRCARPWAATTSGASASDVGRGGRHRESGSSSSWLPTRPTT